MDAGIRQMKLSSPNSKLVRIYGIVSKHSVGAKVLAV